MKFPDIEEWLDNSKTETKVVARIAFLLAVAVAVITGTLAIALKWPISIIPIVIIGLVYIFKN